MECSGRVGRKLSRLVIDALNGAVPFCRSQRPASEASEADIDFKPTFHKKMSLPVCTLYDIIQQETRFAKIKATQQNEMKHSKNTGSRDSSKQVYSLDVIPFLACPTPNSQKNFNFRQCRL